jgi:hypothetical protein
VANTAVSWPGRLRQIQSFFRARSPDEMLATTAPWTTQPVGALGSGRGKDETRHGHPRLSVMPPG